MCSLERAGTLPGAFFIEDRGFHSAKFEDAQNASGEILMTYDFTRNPSTLSGGRLITVLMLVSMLPMMSWRGPFRQSALA